MNSQCFLAVAMLAKHHEFVEMSILKSVPIELDMPEGFSAGNEDLERVHSLSRKGGVRTRNLRTGIP